MSDISYKELGSSPVPGSTPAGDDARYEAEYAAVLEEIEKLSFSGQGDAISWPVVEKNAEIILSQKSKDLQITSYLAVALFQKNGIKGIIDGIDVFIGYFENFWENGWPAIKRMRGRINAVDWWHERCYTFLQNRPSDPVSQEMQTALLDGLDKLDALIADKMPDASSLRDIIAIAKRLSVAEEKAEKEPEPEKKEEKTPPVTEPDNPEPPKAPDTDPLPEQKEPVQEAAPAAPSEKPAPSGNQEITEDPALLRKPFVSSALAYLLAARQAEPANPDFWQLSRIITFGAIRILPSNDNGQTLLPAPNVHQLTQMRAKLKAGNALEAALGAEEIFLISPFYLDAQELIFTALSSMGAPFIEAANKVKEESAKFFSRMQGIEKLSFIDGTAFASPQTISWLKSTASSGAPTVSVIVQQESSEVFALARELAKKNQLNEALQELDKAKTESAAFNLKLRSCQARLLLDAGKTEAAQALAEVLLEEVQAHNLDTWDPDLAFEALACVYDAFNLDEQYLPQLKETRRRLARLRPSIL